MNKANFTTCVVALFLASGLIAGCDRSPNKVTPAGRTSTATEDPHAGHDHSQDHAEPASSATAHADANSAPAPAQEARAAGGTRLALTGLTLLPDPEWSAVPFEAGPMAPVAVLALPAESSDAKPVEIRITHYPNMKGPQMDQRNIERWVGSVRRPDGTPATPEDAKITSSTVGRIRLTVEAPEGAKQVQLLGDFTLWAPIPMRREGVRWIAELDVGVGTYHYRFLVDDEWYLPDDAPDAVPDEWGRMSATLVIEGAG